MERLGARDLPWVMLSLRSACLGVLSAMSSLSGVVGEGESFAVCDSAARASNRIGSLH